VLARAGWWAEIFETPCIAVAAAEAEIADLVATGAEFVGLESALWASETGVVTRAQALLAEEQAG
jgi:thiamine-phosphate pyrophosphorylase